MKSSKARPVTASLNVTVTCELTGTFVKALSGATACTVGGVVSTGVTLIVIVFACLNFRMPRTAAKSVQG